MCAAKRGLAPMIEQRRRVTTKKATQTPNGVGRTFDSVLGGLTEALSVE
jgi:hypothetical protein